MRICTLRVAKKTVYASPSTCRWRDGGGRDPGEGLRGRSRDLCGPFRATRDSRFSISLSLRRSDPPAHERQYPRIRGFRGSGGADGEDKITGKCPSARRFISRRDIPVSRRGRRLFLSRQKPACIEDRPSLGRGPVARILSLRGGGFALYPARSCAAIADPTNSRRRKGKPRDWRRHMFSR